MSTPSSPTVISWEVNFDSHQPIPPFWLLLFQSHILSDLQEPPSAMSVSSPWPTMPMLQFSCRNRPTGSQAAVGFRLDLGRLPLEITTNAGRDKQALRGLSEKAGKSPSGHCFGHWGKSKRDRQVPREQGRVGNWVHWGDIPHDSFPKRDVIRKKVDSQKQSL